MRRSRPVALALALLLVGLAGKSATNGQTPAVNHSVLNSPLFNSPTLRIVTEIVTMRDLVTVPSAFADGGECDGVNPPPNIDCPDPTPTPTATPTPDPGH
ncbi:MAG TPA: hypothetical protein VGE45_20965 [Chloroflexia bacterium]